MMSALCSSFPFLTNAQVPCADVVVQCRDGLIEFAKDFLKVPGKDCKQWEGPCTTESEIYRIGFVGIGTPKTEGWYDGRLIVKGGIVTERLQICKPAWCDYVFSDTFKLRSLPEVEAYVKQHKHLPGSTPQADIEKKGGLSLDVETVNQQEKIEEAYLHLIALKKRMDRLAQKMPVTVLQNTDNQQDRTKLQEQGPHITAAQLPVLPNIVLNCTQLVPASSLTAADGIGGIKVTGIPVPFTITWNGPVTGDMLIDTECGGFIRLVNLKKGTYTVTVEQPGTNNIGSCQLVINNAVRRDCASLEVDPCKTEISKLFKSTFSEEKPDCKQWEGDLCSSTGNIHRLGNVCIGGSVGRSGYSLAVQGGILCDKFRVELCDGKWCDYVFDENYPLPTLEEVQKFITTHRHLPGIVSQAEVTDKGGFELRSVKLDQQEKIEEAYLYLIQLNDRAKALRAQIENLNR